MNKKSTQITRVFVIIFISGVIGYIIGNAIGRTLDKKEDFNIALILITTAFSFILHIVLHEFGHLVAGLVTKYKFVSFRIFNLKIEKENSGKFNCRFYNVAGTAGQCLMQPPKYEKGKLPFKLYIAGGVIMNIVSSVIIFLVYFNIYACIFGIIGVTLAILNAIPMGFNDGQTFLLLNKDENTRYAYYLQLMFNYYASIGKNYLKENPDILETVKQLEISEKNYLTDAVTFMVLSVYQENFEFEKLYEEARKFYIENPEMLIPYKLELIPVLLGTVSLVNPNDELLEEIMNDKLMELKLQKNLPDVKNNLAIYEWRVKKDAQRAFSLLEEGKHIIHKSPILLNELYERKYNKYLLKIISEEFSQGK